MDILLPPVKGRVRREMLGTDTASGEVARDVAFPVYLETGRFGQK